MLYKVMITSGHFKIVHVKFKSKKLCLQMHATLSFEVCKCHLKVIYHPLYSMNNFVTNKSKLPQDGAQVFSYMG